MDLAPYLKLLVERNGSDLYFSPGAPVNIKVEGVTEPLGANPLPPGGVKKLVYPVLSEDQIRQFEQELELDLAISVQDIGRFRLNLFRQRGEVAMVVRHIRSVIPDFAELQLPASVPDLVLEPRGLVLVIGTTGSGKSTTLAAMIQHRNRQRTGHILTIEDPIEFVHRHQKSIVNQREVGLDTRSYASALKRAMREAPDVILIGEIRDRETMEQALGYSETGHLCLSTLHASNARQAFERIINFFPATAHAQLYMDLAMNVRAIIAQRLLRGRDGKRVPAVEIMQSSPYIQELIQKHEIDKINSAMEQNVDKGMQTFDQALYQLYKQGKISMDEALANADSRNNLSLRIRLDEGGVLESPDELHIADEDTP